MTCLLSRFPVFEFGFSLLVHLYQLTSSNPVLARSTSSKLFASGKALLSSSSYRSKDLDAVVEQGRGSSATVTSPRSNSTASKPSYVYGGLMRASSYLSSASSSSASSSLSPTGSKGQKAEPLAEISPGCPIERIVVNIVQEFPLPERGERLRVHFPSGADYSWTRGGPNPLSYVDDSAYALLFQCLEVEHIVKLVECLVWEQRIVFISSDLSLLAPCCEALMSLLWPFFWQHIYIPLLPPELIDYLEAPMPYIMGIHKSLEDEFMEYSPIQDAVQVRLDDRTIVLPEDQMELEILHDFPDPGRDNLVSKLTAKIQESLPNSVGGQVNSSSSFLRRKQTPRLQTPFSVREELKRAGAPKNSHEAAGDASPRPSTEGDAETEDPQGWVDYVRLYFLEAWSEILRPYKQFLRPSEPNAHLGLMPGETRAIEDALAAGDELEFKHGFDRDAFLEQLPSPFHNFLEALIGTQQFLSFVEDACDMLEAKADGAKHEDLEFFDQCIQELVRGPEGAKVIEEKMCRAVGDFKGGDVDAPQVNQEELPETPQTSYTRFPALNTALCSTPQPLEGAADGSTRTSGHHASTGSDMSGDRASKLGSSMRHPTHRRTGARTSAMAVESGGRFSLSTRLSGSFAGYTTASRAQSFAVRKASPSSSSRPCSADDIEPPSIRKAASEDLGSSPRGFGRSFDDEAGPNLKFISEVASGSRRPSLPLAAPANKVEDEGKLRRHTSHHTPTDLLQAMAEQGKFSDDSDEDEDTRGSSAAGLVADDENSSQPEIVVPDGHMMDPLTGKVTLEVKRASIQAAVPEAQTAADRPLDRRRKSSGKEQNKLMAMLLDESRSSVEEGRSSASEPAGLNEKT